MVIYIKRPILIIGLGSIGRRHLQNLLTIGIDRIILYRTGKSTLPDDELSEFRTFNNLEEALKEKPIGAVISNPTSLHISTAIKVAMAGCHILMEKPVSNTDENLAELQKIVVDKKLLFITGYQFRFHPALQQIKNWLSDNRIGNLVSTHVHWGEDVTSWHPWENYSKSYSVRSELGGGVTLTLSHPFDYLRWLIGDVEKLYALTGKCSGLKTDAECVIQIVLKFKNGPIGSVYLDYIEKPARHTLSIIGEQGNIQWDNTDGCAKLFFGGVCAEEYHVPSNFERNTMFLDLVNNFIKCINGTELPLCTLNDGVQALKIALAARQSAMEGREILL
ncbi:MAG: Gfo/Idh/MocA family oxidoreductase [Elusimicrobiota bacterium]